MDQDTRVYQVGTLPVLRVLRGPGEGAVLVLRGCHTLGRSQTCDLVLADPGVSREHARVERGPDGVEVVDLGSTNGTFVNGRKVTQCRLRHGDRLQLGGVVLEYREGP
ncbi:MAG: FHA domain-containing protein [Armatimonadota bacterium]|nr:FHA domain-containing protein [Armatimonadota bacterium]MDR5675492.1 FHA domain-containing protein [Armatimonadota bacterium]MDR5689512.1 FHA domain-containing protein [Armatimonadota bacterium]MDR7389205.1 FHA domain-containing protein [Armatimonadota bacterium]MDR7391998.1 FHA domain-containing protein [Armatimonadota bacterium]